MSTKYIFRADYPHCIPSIHAFGLAALEPARTPIHYTAEKYPHRAEELKSGISAETIAAEEEGGRVPPMDQWKEPRIYACETLDALHASIPGKDRVPIRIKVPIDEPIYDDGTMAQGTIYCVFPGVIVGQSVIPHYDIDILDEGNWTALAAWLKQNSQYPIPVHTDNTEPIHDFSETCGTAFEARQITDNTPIVYNSQENDAVAASSHFNVNDWEIVERSRIHLDDGTMFNHHIHKYIQEHVGKIATFKTVICRKHGNHIFLYSAETKGIVHPPQNTNSIEDYFTPLNQNRPLSSLRKDPCHPRNRAYINMHNLKIEQNHKTDRFSYGETWADFLKLKMEPRESHLVRLVAWIRKLI